MADDLLELGTNDTVLDIQPNWATSPKLGKDILVVDNIYPGTIHDIGFSREPVKKFSIQVSDGENKLYSVLLLFVDRVARLKAFWFPDVTNLFIPLSISLDGLNLYVKKNTTLYLHGYERIFFRMKNGNRISRRIIDSEQLEESTKLVFQIPIVGMDITKVAICTFLYYGRFDQDSIEIEYLSPTIAQTTLTFIELFEEYKTWL